MKYFWLFLVFCSLSGSATIIRFKTSKPLCLLTFLEAATGNPDVSPALASYTYTHLANADTAKFLRLVQDFASIPMDFSYVFDAYPKQRQNSHGLKSIITAAAVQTDNLPDFLQRIVGFLPGEQWEKLKQILTDVDPIYEKLIEQPNKTAIKKQLAKMEEYNAQADVVFNKLKHFYGSAWSSEIPFTIAVYPVPGDNGITTASPHGNSIVLGTLTGEKDIPVRVSIAIHEMCHVLYEAEPLTLQNKIDRLFKASPDPNSSFAYNFIDEALATACGNGWAYRQLYWKKDTGSWYANSYIDGYAHAIYPLVEQYLNAGKQMDSTFIRQAITIFGNKFPGAYKEFTNLMNRINLYTDATGSQQYGIVSIELRNAYTISSFSASYPINDHETIGLIDQSTVTQVFVIHTSHKDNYKFLSAKFPQIKGLDPAKEGLISFFDDKKRPIIILNVKDISRLKTGIKLMAKCKEIDPTKIWTPLD